MNNEQSQTIVKRFFAALERLKNDGVIYGKKTFTDRYQINRWNFYTLEHDPGRDIFQVAWLENLVMDYKVNPLYLLTGFGDFYLYGWTSTDVAAHVKTCKKRATKI